MEKQSTAYLQIGSLIPNLQIYLEHSENISNIFV
jgi:hypothetical protein